MLLTLRSMRCCDSRRGRQRRSTWPNLSLCRSSCCTYIFWCVVASSLSLSSAAAASQPQSARDKLLQAFSSIKKKKNVDSSSSSNSSNNMRIAGGIPAGLLEFPSFVSGKFPGCGANRIWNDIVISAAHCAFFFVESPPWKPGISNDTVQVGPWTRNNNDDTLSGGGESVLIASEIQLHPLYLQSSGTQYDFLLFKIVPPTTPALQNAIAPFNRNASNDPSGEDLLTVIGFGQTQQNGALSDRLLRVEVPHVSLEACRQRYKGFVQGESMFCAGFLDGGKGTCPGDSGGPIFDASGTQVGVVSWGECAREGFPQIYSRISAASDWLLPTICNLTDFPDGLNCDTVPPYVPPPPQPPDAGCSDTLPCHFPGHDYRGCQNTTALGEPCLAWNAVLPDDFPPGFGIAGLDNFCRNPDHDEGGPWCRIFDPLDSNRTWEFCNISACERPALTETQFCAGADEDEASSGITCTAQTTFTDYFGCVNETVSGYPCQPWNMQFPQIHDFIPEDYPFADIKDGAYCRNPDQDEGGPWCFTQNPRIRWEYCYIPECDNGLSSCRATGESCAYAAKCCDDNMICKSTSAAAISSTCQACGGLLDFCTESQDCCNAGVSAKCGELLPGTDIKVCLPCAGKGSACDLFTDCCNQEEATCREPQPTTMKMKMMMTMMKGGAGGMMKMRKLTTRKMKQEAVRSTMKCSA